MNQPVLFSPTLMEKYINDHDGKFDKEHRRLLDLMQLELLCIDKTGHIVDLWDKAFKEARNWGWPYMREWDRNLAEIRKFPIELSGIEPVQDRVSGLNLELRIAHSLFNPRWVREDLDDDSLKLLSKRKLPIPVKIAQYLSGGSCKLQFLHPGLHIELAPGDPFDFEDVFGALLRDSDYITIKDGYITNERATGNCVRLLALMKQHASVTIETLSDEVRKRKHKDYGADGIRSIKRFRKIIRDHSEGLDVSIKQIDDKKLLRERMIYTERYAVSFHGLDSFADDEVYSHTNFIIAERTEGKD